MKIINFRSNEDIDIQFLDQYKFVKEHCTYNNFKNHIIANPYDKIVYGVGYFGYGEYKTGTAEHHTLSYMTWYGMIRRCYADVKKDFFKAYYHKCTVCDEWHNYQNFAKWYDENYYEIEGRLHVDKDILSPGNMCYSPDKCLLVPQRINMLFLNKPNSRGLPNGIIHNKKGYSARYNENKLGTYKTLEEAYFYYAKAKEEFIKKIAEEYKDRIPKKLYDALLCYEVHIENDKNYVA